MPRPEKVAQVEELKEKLAQARSVVLVDYLGLTASECVELRRLMRKQGVEFRVIKNTLARRAAREVGAEFLLDYLQGPNAIVVGGDDPTVPYRVSRECANKYGHFRIKAGLFEGEPVPPEQVEWYATLPSREELLGRLAGGLAGPIRGLAVALSGIIRGLVVALSEVKQQKEKKG